MQLILSCFSASPTLTSILFAGHSSNNFETLPLSGCLDELLSAPKIAPFLKSSLPKTQ